MDPRNDGKIFVRPVADRSVPRTDGLAWPEFGDWLDPDLYVRRRLADGDLKEVAPPTEAEIAAVQARIDAKAKAKADAEAKAKADAEAEAQKATAKSADTKTAVAIDPAVGDLPVPADTTKRK